MDGGWNIQMVFMQIWAGGKQMENGIISNGLATWLPVSGLVVIGWEAVAHGPMRGQEAGEMMDMAGGMEIHRAGMPLPAGKGQMASGIILIARAIW